MNEPEKHFCAYCGHHQYLHFGFYCDYFGCSCRQFIERAALKLSKETKDASLTDRFKRMINTIVNIVFER